MLLEEKPVKVMELEETGNYTFRAQANTQTPRSFRANDNI
jgi:hypothetical protein